MAPADHEVQTSASPEASRRWIVTSLVGLTAVLLAGSWWLAHSVQSGLETAARQRLSDAGVPASVHYDGRAAIVTAQTPADASAAADLLRGWRGTTAVEVAEPAGSGAQDARPTPTPSASPTAEPSTTPSATPSPTAQPSDASPTKRRHALARVLFPANGAVLDTGDKVDLDRAASYLDRHRHGRLLVFGNTDNQGPDSWGWYMSHLRATAVADYLRYRGVDEDQLVVRWFADQRPAASNDTDTGRQTNRRVDVIYDPRG